MRYIFILFFIAFFTFLVYPKQEEIKLKDSMQDLSSVYYKNGLEYASNGEFDLAKEEFKKSIELNKFNIDVQSALKILEKLEKKEIEPTYVSTLFTNLLLKLEIKRISSELNNIKEDFLNVKKDIELLSKNINSAKEDLENKNLNLRSKVDSLKDDVDYIKNRIR